MYTIDQLQQIKVLGDRQALAILRRLMERPATLTQLGEAFGSSPAHVRHHLKALEAARLVELSAVRPVRGFLEKYYRATERAYLIQVAVFPDAAGAPPPVVIGSNDPALRQALDGEVSGAAFLNLNSLDGLTRLRDGICEMATLHLQEASSGEYNRPFVQHFFPGEDMVLVRLFHREEGLLVRPGNPLGVRGVEDLARPGVRLANRERGAGTRVWLDQALAARGIAKEALAGYGDEVRSHGEVAEAVAAGKADAGLGLPESARQAGLDFIPLFDEPYDLVMRRESYTAPRARHLLEQLDAQPFQEAIRRLAGYYPSRDHGQVSLVP